MISNLITKNKNRMIEILRSMQVKSAYLFGSVLTENFDQDSDIDILISFDENLDPLTYGDNYFSLIDQLESLLGRRVDLTTEKSLSNPYFIKELNNTKVSLYE
ncbi:nucleotidyltransferase [Jiulongibacter sediminis]|uniref:Nucleotidyltransferase n=2 Tax=Jiulongibacter sediminis TaxID=1605367 RepID=A0A0P7BNS1_9BACT|nr:nucleotidyltransferase [Jiulongibacter sediminis]TBX25394.1 nucleotidyltransferase [Jiulongibacter sediminis]